MMNVKEIRKLFPIFNQVKPLHYLDSAASSLKPQIVLDAMDSYYEKLGVNVHRGTYQLTYEATDLYEKARSTVANFINAATDEVVFTRGATEALNMVAYSYRNILKPGDEIITSELEHHSQLIPWQVTAKKTGAKLVFIPLDKAGKITVENFSEVLSDKTKVVAINHVSNALGYETPVKEITRLAHEKQAIVSLDAAQSIAHQKIDVKELNVDFLAFSGHKMFGPSGIGVLYGKKELLNDLEPMQYGGEMADDVFHEYATVKPSPIRFEAGTPIIAGAIGLGSAIEFILALGYDKIHTHLTKLHQMLIAELKKIKEVTLYNETASHPTVTFNIKDIHPHDIASYLDQKGVSVRAGHHCAQLVSRFLNVPSTLRVSLHIYNTEEDLFVLIDALKEAYQFFSSF